MLNDDHTAPFDPLGTATFGGLPGRARSSVLHVRALNHHHHHVHAGLGVFPVP